ncbi:MAG: hypothetical protein ACYCO3_11720 [Mycobacteriales bacterium]
MATYALVASVVVIVVDLFAGFTIGQGAKSAPTLVLLVVNVAAAVIAFRLARAWQRATPPEGTPVQKWWDRHHSGWIWQSPTGRQYVLPTLNALLAVIVPWLVLPIEGLVALARARSSQGDVVPDPSDYPNARAEADAEAVAWRARIEEFEAQEARRYGSADLWYPVGPSQATRVACLFGGQFTSWAACLATFGPTVVAAGGRMLVCDLSRRRATGPLLDLAQQLGVTTSRYLIPSDAAHQQLFTGIDWNDLTTLVVEVIHSANTDLDASRRERQEDRSILRDVCGCLDPSRAVSLARLRQALLVVEAVDTEGGAGAISAEEFDRLSRLFNDVQREQGGVIQRVARLERVLRDLERLERQDGRASADGASGAPGAPADAAAIEIVEVDKTLDDLDAERLVEFVFQLLLRRLRLGVFDSSCLTILGADRIKRDALESLATYAQQSGIRLVLFFEHLRDEAIQLIGGGGAAAGFFTLSNHREAKEGSDYIGEQFKFLEFSRTRTDGESLSQTWGRERSTTAGQSVGAGGESRSSSETQGTNYSFGQTRSHDYGVTEQRVREAVVQPEVLMGLPPTAMLYVEILPDGRRDPHYVDCNPDVRFAPRLSREPYSVAVSR